VTASEGLCSTELVSDLLTYLLNCKLLFTTVTKTGPSDSPVEGTYVLEASGHWGHGFEFRFRHECVSPFFFIALSRAGKGLAMGRSLVQHVL